jgi:hypothetical protein
MYPFIMLFFIEHHTYLIFFFIRLHDNDAGNAALRELLKQEIRSIENKTIKSLGGNYVINKIN